MGNDDLCFEGVKNLSHCFSVGVHQTKQGLFRNMKVIEKCPLYTSVATLGVGIFKLLTSMRTLEWSLYLSLGDTIFGRYHLEFSSCSQHWWRYSNCCLHFYVDWHHIKDGLPNTVYWAAFHNVSGLLCGNSQKSFFLNSSFMWCCFHALQGGPN